MKLHLKSRITDHSKLVIHIENMCCTDYCMDYSILVAVSKDIGEKGSCFHLTF